MERRGKERTREGTFHKCHYFIWMASIITFRCCKGLFDTGNVKRAFRTTFKRRPFNVRPFLLILISVLVILDVMHKGPQPIGLLFFRGV